MQTFNRFLDRLSEYLAHRKGLLPILGILLILVNFVLRASGVGGWLIDVDLLLHLGVIVAILGFMVVWAL